jgi:AcrR family transcriptional regulator
MTAALSSSTDGPRQAPASTPERLVEAATRLFSERGYHAVGMRELAEAIGVRPASLYNHVASKQELLFRIAHGTMTELREGALRAIEDEPDARARVRAWVVWHVTYHAQHRARAKVTDEQFQALDAERLGDVLEARDAYERLVKRLVDDGVAEHGWVVPHRSVVTNAITTMCTAVDGWFREDGPLSAREIADIYADLVLAALERGER